MNWSIYTNDVVSQDETAIEFLRNSSQWKFLIDKDLILFYTTKNGNDIYYSYEYKLKPFFDKDFNDFLKIIENAEERRAVEYFSRERYLGEYKNGGLWFFGIEKRKNSKNDILKVYFKAFYEKENGETLFDESFGNLIENCGISAMKIIMQEIYGLLQYGFELYMVGWNYDYITKKSKYKVYCKAKEECQKEEFSRAIQKMFSILNIDLINFEKEQELNLCGFCYGIVADQVSVNLYYKETRQ